VYGRNRENKIIIVKLSFGVPGPWVSLGEASVNKEISVRKNFVQKYIEARLNVLLLTFFGLGL
jgi:hypothetical protein